MKGKQGQAAANRRVTALEGELAAIRQQLDDEREVNRSAEKDLREQVQNLRNRLTSDVQALAAEQVLKAKQEATDHVIQERSDWEDRAAAAAAILARHNVILPSTAWESLAKALQVPLGVILGGSRESNRYVRRASRSALTRLQTMQDAGRPI